MDSRDEILAALKLHQTEKHSQRKIRKSAIIKGSPEIFAIKAREAGANVVMVNGKEAAKTALSELLSRLEGDIIYSSEQLIKDINIVELAKKANKNAINAEAESLLGYKHYVMQSKMGLSSCDYAIQDTGSIVIAHREQNESLISLAPENYICIIEAEDILENRYMLATIIEEEVRLPAAYSVITGVSRTTDLALQVVTGMHGPQNIFIILIK